MKKEIEAKLNILLSKVIDYLGIDDLNILYGEMIEDSVLDTPFSFFILA